MVPHKRNSKVWPGDKREDNEVPHNNSVCVCVCEFVSAFKPGTYNKRNNRVPSWKKAPVCQMCTKHMRGVAKMLRV